MATQWFAGRGKAKGEKYVVKRNHLQRWINKHGYLSLPIEDVKRIKKSVSVVLFYDLVEGTKFICDADLFRNGVPDDMDEVMVDIENFDIQYRGVE